MRDRDGSAARAVNASSTQNTPIGTPETLTEDQLLEFLLKELEAFVER